MQSPAAGSRVRVGTRVDLVVAARPQPATPAGAVVPKVVCLDVKRAADLVARQGLRPAYSGQGPVVARQSPGPGTRVSPGSTVTLYLGRTCG